MTDPALIEALNSIKDSLETITLLALIGIIASIIFR
jgi:hypothetical protein